MNGKALHRWDLPPQEAAKVQSQLRERLELRWDGREVEFVGGVDIGLRGEMALAAIVILSYPELEPIEAVTAQVPVLMPYISGFLAFREGPAVLSAWERVRRKPDLLLFDGQGIAHPRGVGIASQMGLWLETPSIGVAKSRLYGVHDEPGPGRGERAVLKDSSQAGKAIGMVLRTRERVKPVYVSPGHLIDLERAVDFTMRCTTKYRLPEPTRWADKVAGGAKLPKPDGQARLF